MSAGFGALLCAFPRVERGSGGSVVWFWLQYFAMRLYLPLCGTLAAASSAVVT